MEYQTQFMPRRKSPGEITGDETPVVKTLIRGNSEKIAQMMLAGQYVEASRLGYEYGPEDKLPDQILTRPDKGADIIHVLKYVEDFGTRVREQVKERERKARDVRSNTGVSEENGSSSEGEKEKIGSREGEKAYKSPESRVSGAKVIGPDGGE